MSHSKGKLEYKPISGHSDFLWPGTWLKLSQQGLSPGLLLEFQGWGNFHFCWFSCYKDCVKYKVRAPNRHLRLSNNKSKREHRRMVYILKASWNQLCLKPDHHIFPVNQASKFCLLKVIQLGFSYLTSKTVKWCFLKTGKN